MLYVSMSGASQNTLAMRAHANNLANISTSGFRRDFEQARSMQVFGDSFPARVFAMSERPGTDFSHGSLQETGNELDIAIDGDGFVAVQAPDGSEAYVRTAGMHIDALGMLRTGDGLPVLGNGGPIAVPPEEKVEIGQDGTISIRALGENPNVVAVVDRIKLVNPNLKQMEKGTDGLLHYKPQPGGQSTQDSELPSGLQLGTGVRVVGTQKIFTPGSLQTTEQPLDMAVNGRGFFQVLLPDGTVSYTRDGSFHLNSDGQIVTSNGFALEPAIVVPNETQTFTVGQDGTVSVTTTGNAQPQVIGNIQTADFINPAGLQAIGNNLFLETGSSGAPQVGTPGLNGLGTVAQNTLENSNVNVVEELVNMITTQRAYEMNSKVISTADQMLSFVTQNL
ncbi:TPA: flagellar basal-body rod protein FlgG [Pseudomonas aeruginosa]